jgi:hypothetical protein
MGESFCPHCGEKRRDENDLSLAAFAAHLLESLVQLDGKLLRTLRGLLRPGYLTAEFVRGARVRWMRPLQLFLLVNVVYFFVHGWTGFITFTTTLGAHEQTWYGGIARRLAEKRELSSGLTHASFAARFDLAGVRRANLLIIILIPMVAFVLSLVERSKHRRIGVHMALAAEFMTFQLIAICMLFPLVLTGLYALAPRAWSELSANAHEGIVSGIGAVVMWIFFALALPRVYGDARGAAIARGLLAVLGFCGSLFLYRALLFFVTLATL